VVFFYSLKDMRPTAPQMSCGSGAGHTRPTAQIVPIRATQPDIALRCCWAFLPVRPSAAEIFSAQCRYRIELCADTVSSRDFSRRRCERFGD